MSFEVKLPALNPSAYAWEQSLQSKLVLQRKALAGEWSWIPKVDNAIFISGSLHLNSPTTHRRLHGAANKAWRALRFEVPELVVSSGMCGKDGQAFMQYQAPGNEEEIAHWIQRSSRFQHGVQKLEFNDLRAKLVHIRGSQYTDRTFLLAHAQAQDQDDESVSCAQIILYVDHTVTDGIGIRIIFGKYLTLLASYLGKSPNAPQVQLNWEDSARNLYAPWISLMNEEQIISGPEYEACSEFNTWLFLRRMVPYLPM